MQNSINEVWYQDALDLKKNHLINNRWVEGTGSPLRKTDPYYQEILFEGFCATEHEINDAVHFAQNAMIDWYRKGFSYRALVLSHYAKLLESNKPDLAAVIAKETGKPLWEALTEVQSMIGKIAISIEAYSIRTPEKEIQNNLEIQALAHKPHGVLVVLGPYNFPGHLPNGHIIPALLAGNSVIFKPSEQTPLTGMFLVRLLLEAGVDDGVIQLVQGDKNTGEVLVKHNEINGILFTGSQRVGTEIHKMTAGQVNKLVALEMGGNNPLIIEDFKDINAAVYTVLLSSFISAGQRCTCSRRLLVKNGREGDDFIKYLVRAVQTIRQGAWDQQPAPFMGTVINVKTAYQLLDSQEKLLKLGAQALVTMKSIDGIATLLSPGILEATGAKLPDEEYFGPLLTLYRYDTFDEAIRLANATQFGLAAGIITQHRSLFDQFRTEVNAGIINWNKPLTGASSNAPFGGIGLSGNHRPSAFYAADYCAYPAASLASSELLLPTSLVEGISLS